MSQKKLPNNSAENAPGTVKMRFSAVVVPDVLRTHKSFAPEPSRRGIPNPKLAEIVPFSMTLPLLQPQCKNKKNDDFGHVLTPRPDRAPWDPGPGQPKAGPKGQPGARAQGCNWAILTGRNHEKSVSVFWGCHPDNCLWDFTSSHVAQGTPNPNGFWPPMSPEWGLGMAKGPQNGPTGATGGPLLCIPCGK